MSNPAVDIEILGLRAELDHALNQIKHLNRSQTELLQELNQCEDIDYRQAYDENNIVISGKIHTIKQLTDKLLLIDPAFYIEQRLTDILRLDSTYRPPVNIINTTTHTNTNTANQSSVTVSQQTVTPVSPLVSLNNHTSIESEGIYL